MAESQLAAFAATRGVLCSAGVMIFLATGCGGPSGVAPPDWAPDAMADAAMELSDKNGDGILDKQELSAAPGLKAAAEAEGGSADLDGNGELSRDEVRNRIAYYQETAQGMQAQGLEVRLGGRPLSGANVELTPEPFLASVLEPARATTRGDGWAVPAVQGMEFIGVQPGMYRIVVTGSSQPIPQKYTAGDTTPLGIEITVPREGYGAQKPPVFNLDTK